MSPLFFMFFFVIKLNRPPRLAQLAGELAVAGASVSKKGNSYTISIFFLNTRYRPWPRFGRQYEPILKTAKMRTGRIQRQDG